MTVVQTDRWLLRTKNQPLQICEKLKPSFKGYSTEAIYELLTSYGMFRKPIKGYLNHVKSWQERQFWKVIHKELKKLRQKWNGPDVPIYILPSDPFNRQLLMHHNGKSGLAFRDQIFLFISPKTTEQELAALFTHEYNHVCRLSKYVKKEYEYTLLDSIILEGLAENGVREQIGETYLAPWTRIYKPRQLRKFWKQLLLPASTIPIHHRKHDILLYGSRLYPKMLGYAVGYHLVYQYLTLNSLTVKDIIDQPSETIAQFSHDKNKKQADD